MAAEGENQVDEVVVLELDLVKGGCHWYVIHTQGRKKRIVAFRLSGMGSNSKKTHKGGGEGFGDGGGGGAGH